MCKIGLAAFYLVFAQPCCQNTSRSDWCAALAFYLQIYESIFDMMNLVYTYLVGFWFYRSSRQTLSGKEPSITRQVVEFIQKVFKLKILLFLLHALKNQLKESELLSCLLLVTCIKLFYYI